MDSSDDDEVYNPRLPLAQHALARAAPAPALPQGLQLASVRRAGQAEAWQQVWQQAHASNGAPNPNQLGNPLSAHMQDIRDDNVAPKDRCKNLEAALEALTLRFERLEAYRGAGWPSERDEH